MIEIKTKINSLKYELPVHTLKNKNNIFKRLFMGKPKYEEIKFTGSPEFEPLTLTITDEINSKEWIFESYTIGKKKFDYKKNLKVFDKKGNEYHLYGCFPIDVNGESVKICYDRFTKNKKMIVSGQGLIWE